MEFIKDTLIIICVFAVLGIIVEGARLYSGFALFLWYLFYFLILYGILYEQYTNYRKDGFIQNDGTDFIHIPVILITIFAFYVGGIMLYDETISYMNNK